MRLLLDTHVLLWALEPDQRLGSRARTIIDSRESSVWVSAVVAWEIAIKFALGRLRLTSPPQISLPAVIKEGGYLTLDITVAHGFAAGALPPIHADPFDRMLVAQARIEGLTLLTADPTIRQYDVATLDATL